MTNNDPTLDRYALIGHPVEHSRSPLIHTLFARQTEQLLTYELIDAAPTAFEAAVREFFAGGGRGLNVTVPHKGAAFNLVDEVSEAAATAGAVNTISLNGDYLRGENTDGIGFIRDVTVNQRQELAGRRVLMLGAGGAARGILGPVLATRPREVVIGNRTLERAEKLLKQFGEPPELSAAEFPDLAALGSFDVLINATSAGLKGEAPPFPSSLISRASFCYDLVYSVKDTPFVKWARAHDAASAIQGWGMLIEQAAESFHLWRGVRPDTGPLLKQLVR